MEIEKDTRTMEDVTKLERSLHKTECRKVVFKVAAFVLALCGFGLSITGVVQLHQVSGEVNWPNRFVWELYNFQWWVLAFEAFVLVLLVVMDGLDIAKEVYPMLTGLLLFACMQTEQAGWLAWNCEGSELEWETWSCGNRWSRERNLTAAGFALLFCVNILAAVIMGLGGFPRNCSERSVARDDKKSVRIVGLILAAVGISGVAMVAVVVADSCEDKCEDSWWSLAWHLFALLLFIFTQIVAKMDAFKPVLTVLLASQIRRFELNVDATDEPLGKVGLLVTIISAYLLIILFMESQMEYKDIGKCGWWCEDFLTCLSPLFLIGVIMSSAFDLFEEEYSSPVSAWILAFRIMTIIFWIVCLKKPRLLLKLPLVAFMAMAIYHSPFSTHAWLMDDQDLAIRGIVNLILTVLFLFLIMVGV